MERTRRGQPAFEPLESRKVLSAGPASDAATAAAELASHQNYSAWIATSSTTVKLALNGTIQGTWTSQVSAPNIDGGPIQTLTGSGKISPLGQISADSTLHSPGFIVHGRTSGTLTLTDSQGNSLTLNLTGASMQRGFTGPPAGLTFAIVGGTGTYSGATGSGTARLKEWPQSGHPLPPGVGATSPNDIIVRSFTLTLHAGG